jgi:hypothetical protein
MMGGARTPCVTVDMGLVSGEDGLRVGCFPRRVEMVLLIDEDRPPPPEDEGGCISPKYCSTNRTAVS